MEQARKHNAQAPAKARELAAGEQEEVAVKQAVEDKAVAAAVDNVNEEP